jgi:5''-nucleotidase/2'',3''-cyclic phosphodiesterase and related esterases
VMNKMGYTAITVGNHEFDDGSEVLRVFVDAVNFPILMSNPDISGEALLRDVIQEPVVIEQAGEKIGLIGLTPEDTDELVSPGPTVIFSDPSEVVQVEVDRLTAMGGEKDHRAIAFWLSGRLRGCGEYHRCGCDRRRVF